MTKKAGVNPLNLRQGKQPRENKINILLQIGPPRTGISSLTVGFFFPTVKEYRTVRILRGEPGLQRVS